jgi:hypothetical protein
MLKEENFICLFEYNYQIFSITYIIFFFKLLRDNHNKFIFVASRGYKSRKERMILQGEMSRTHFPGRLTMKNDTFYTYETHIYAFRHIFF